MASVSQYDRGAGSRSIVVCGGWSQSVTAIASCEELAIDTDGLPAASSWSSFASLPNALYGGCMLQVNGKVRFLSDGILQVSFRAAAVPYWWLDWSVGCEQRVRV